VRDRRTDAIHVIWLPAAHVSEFQRVVNMRQTQCSSQ
jgi:hypothetical protein